MLHQCINVYNVIFIIYFIVMASNSNPSPSEDNTSGTDLSNIHTEDEEQIDTTGWMPAKHKKNYNTWWSSMRNTNMFFERKRPFAL